MPHRFLIALAKAFAGGEQTAAQITGRTYQVLGKRWGWVRYLVRRYFAAFPGRRPRLDQVIDFLEQDELLERVWNKYGPYFPHITLPRTAPVASEWKLPRFMTPRDLAEWLQLESPELDWFADLKRLGYQRKTASKLRHYHYRVLAKHFGSIRLIEAPKRRMKELQRRILEEILNEIPKHAAVHGFAKGRSIQTFVHPHVGQRIVLRMDLQDFFPSITRTRVQRLFETIGYPKPVAGLLGGICTNAAPRDVWDKLLPEARSESWRQVRDLYSQAHLPQGSPSSPSLANLCAYRADCRLTGLAKSAGANYTRYADDLAFSGGGDFERCVERFSIQAAAILLEEGFSVHHRKTRIMRQGVRQYLTGLVVNQRVNIIRADFDRLKAALTNCVRNGPESQSRAHLEGRVAFVESVNPAKGRKLREILERIDWRS